MTRQFRWAFGALAALVIMVAPSGLSAQAPVVTPDGGTSGTVDKLVSSTNQTVTFLLDDVVLRDPGDQLQRDPRVVVHTDRSIRGIDRQLACHVQYCRVSRDRTDHVDRQRRR